VHRSEKNVKKGERVFAFGTPVGLFDADMLPKFEGFYAGKTTDVPKPDGSKTVFPVLDGYTIPARPGSSGGPIFNSQGEVIGMMIMARPYFETFTLSPTQEMFRTVLKAIKQSAQSYTP
jgi:S1-C subfamily serine protease